MFAASQMVVGDSTVLLGNSRENVGSMKMVAVFIAIFGLLLMPSPVSAETSFFAEDFTTTTFMDATQTNATGWGSGAVKLPSREITLDGSYSFPGVVVDIAIDGEYMYATDGIFRVLNTTDPVHLAPLGSASVSGFICVEGDFAYVSEATKSTIGSTLRVVNVTDPTNPTLLPNGAPGGGQLCVSGNYAYCASGTAGLRIVNITNPSKPTLVSTVSIVDQGFQSLCVSGDYVYVAEDFWIRIVDVSDPVHPAIISSVATDGDHRAIAAFGMYVMVAGDAREVEVMDVSNPHSPRPVSFYILTDRIYDFQIDGHYAYLATLWKKLVVLDISNPLNIVEAESWFEGDSDVVCVSGGYAYVVDNVSGNMNIVAISDPTSPASVGVYFPPSAFVWNVFVSGSYAYVANSEQLTIVSVTDPESPEYVANVATSGRCQDVYVSGHYAYVACGTSGFFGLRVINISDSAYPSIIGSYSTGTNGRGVHIDGDYAYLADESAGLRVFNITNPSLPSLVATCPTGGLAYSLFIRGDYAYVAIHEGGLAVVNITDPTKPELLKVYDTPGTADGVFVSGDIAYVADGYTGLIILDISNPGNPTYLAAHATPNPAWGIDVSGGLAYVGLYTGSNYYLYLDVVNVTDPANPTLHARTGLGCNSIVGLCIDGEYAYIADFGIGLRIAEVRRNRYRQFETLAVAQSTTVFTGSASSSLSYATLTWTGTEPAGSEITFFLSPDNGLHCEEVLSDVRHDFVNSGRQLVWKSVLTSADHLTTPILSQLSISFAAVLNPPLLLMPSDGIFTTDSTPTFEWSAISDATGYLLQIDSTPSFESVDLLNVTVTSATSHTPAAPLSDGTWYWRVAANDSSGDLGEFSSTWQMTIDTSAPTFDEVPVDQTIEFGDTFRYDLNASDPSGLDAWWLNDTVHFDIDDNGVVTSLAVIPVGVYGLQVWVNDTFGHTLTAAFTVVVQDTLPPAWVEVPENQVVEFGCRFRYDLNATDLSGSVDWWVNDTAHFTIDDAGIVVNITSLTVRVYSLEVRASDRYNHAAIAGFQVSVQDTTPPSWVVVPTDEVAELGTWFHFRLYVYDLSGLGAMWINDTMHFEPVGVYDIDGFHFAIENASTLQLGTYGLEIRIYDPHSNYCSATIAITVEDTTPPSWLVPPTDQSLSYGVSLAYQLEAFDLSGVVSWQVNDTVHFTISSSGRLTNSTILSSGIYGIKVTVSDPYGNTLTGVFAIRISATTTVTTTGINMGIVALAIAGGGIAVVLVVVILLRWSKSSLRGKVS